MSYSVQTTRIIIYNLIVVLNIRSINPLLGSYLRIYYKLFWIRVTYDFLYIAVYISIHRILSLTIIDNIFFIIKIVMPEDSSSH